MKSVWHLSDTHGFHDKIIPPSSMEDIDLIVHSGDVSESRDPYTNENEVRKFLTWFKQFEVPKILIAGNHDTSIEEGLWKKEDIERAGGCTYLEHEVALMWNGVRFFGSPYTPFFQDWAFNKNPNKMEKLWSSIDPYLDVLITHGPAKGILDLALDAKWNLKQAGDANLYNRMMELPGIQLHLFGHIHGNGKTFRNTGVMQVGKWLASNASAVVDGSDYGKTIHHGNVLQLFI